MMTFDKKVASNKENVTLTFKVYVHKLCQSLKIYLSSLIQVQKVVILKLLGNFFILVL